MRYVKDKLVLRLHRVPGPELLTRLHDEFSSILVTGKFEVQAAFARGIRRAKSDRLATLVFQFNRRHLGKLRHVD